MDGKPVTLNSQVFDMIYGPGIVADVEGFVVQFDGHFQKYTGDGWNTTWKKRTLYWSEPLVIVPNADIQKANKVRDVLKQIQNMIES